MNTRLKLVSFVSTAALLLACGGHEDEQQPPSLDEGEALAPPAEGFAEPPVPSLNRFENPFAPNPGSDPITLRLRARDVTPAPGVAEEVVDAARDASDSGQQFVRVYAQRKSIPSLERWEGYEAAGIFAEEYVNNLTWVLRVSLDEGIEEALGRVEHEFEAVSVFAVQPGDKVEPALSAGEYESWAEADGGRVRVLVTRYRSAPVERLDDWATTFHGGSEEASRPSELQIALEVDPSRLDELAAQPDVAWIEQGPIPMEPLMADVTHWTGAANVQELVNAGPPSAYTGFTGRDVVVSNNEGLDSGHDDFWNHDDAGNRTTPRWQGCPGGNGSHGTMTAGIMMGNGFRSEDAGAAPLAYRGMAPEATFGCPWDADVSNWSFVDTYGDYSGGPAARDRQIRGEGGITMHHPHVGAVANQGITAQYGKEKGYYSVYRTSKNEIVVGNISSTDWRWNGSSLGPTWDGRLKPDVAAMGGANKWSDTMPEFRVDIDEVSVTGPNARTWSFDDSSRYWTGGFGSDWWWDQQNLSDIHQGEEGPTETLSFVINPPPWGTAWSNRPRLGTRMEPDGRTPLAFVGASTDQITLRYRTTRIPMWDGSPLQVYFGPTDNPATSHDERYYSKQITVPLHTDGEWHTATVDVGQHQDRNGVSGWTGVNIGFVHFRFEGPLNHVPEYGSQGYATSGGSSAAAPVVAGGVALLMHQIVEQFGVDLSQRGASPFAIDAPGTAMPLSSTFKALLVQTARDLASIPGRTTAINPDTGVPTVYHPGPDLATGYGMVDVRAASDHLAAEANAQAVSGAPTIIERELTTMAGDAYEVEVKPGQSELKVTLAWDDPAGSMSSPSVEPKLVNNLDLLLKGPDGLYYLPWSLQQPYEPTDPATYPVAVEPEPIRASDIVAARRDRPNNRDNVEQVYVEMPKAGTWQVFVLPGGLALPPQQYSLVLPKPGDDSVLRSGKLAFASDRNGQTDIFVKDLSAGTPPVQVSGSYFTGPKGFPEISPDGRLVTFVARDYYRSGRTRDALIFVGTNGAFHGIHSAQEMDYRHVRYPHWSPDGKKLLVTVFDDWGRRELRTLHLDTSVEDNPYGWVMITSQEVTIPRSSALSPINPANGVFSPDGKHVFFRADDNYAKGMLFSASLDGSNRERLWGNNQASRLSFAPSVSPDGSRIIFNSEMYLEDPNQYLDAELLEIGVHSGVIKQLTRAPGNEYGRFAWGGTGEFVVQASDTSGGNNDLYLVSDGVRVKVDIGDPDNQWNDAGGSWTKN